MNQLRHWMIAVSALGLSAMAYAQSTGAQSTEAQTVSNPSAVGVVIAQEQAEAQLSARYASLWAQLPAAQRPAFSARERQWLNAGRWQEKDACVAERGAQIGTQAGAQADPQVGSACVVEVTLRHVRALGADALVSN